ncbi:pantoate--beta-alanine ligase [Corynebacterium tapiri]
MTSGEAVTVADLERIRMVGSALRKTGRPVILVPLGSDVHAGHIALIRAARSVPRACVVVAYSGDADDPIFAREKVDVVWHVQDSDLWPSGRRVRLAAQTAFEDVDDELTRIIALIGALGPSEVVVGEKDWELAWAVQRAVRDLHLPTAVKSVPTVRMPNGLAISLRNTQVAEDCREQASALSAALVAGAHVAEQGREAVVRVARDVLAAAGIEPEYLELTARDMGPAPETGDGRLLVAAEIGGVRLIDNVGVPIGIGFRNLDGEA